ncbi:MAG: hypothetical protein M5U34_39130 [Chloroflexi bacterium]|nr:hypothetical protein [Chloroflexota bacterium]
MQPTPLWQTRWQALATTLSEMKQTYQTLGNPTFAALTTCLQAFGEDPVSIFPGRFQQRPFTTLASIPPGQYLPGNIGSGQL